MPPNCTHAPSAAKLFVQLSTGARLQSSILDVFLPLHAQRARTYRSHASAGAAPSRPATRPRTRYIAAPCFPRAGPSGVAVAAAPRRAFSSTSAARRTFALHNPQADENGEEMVVEITARAANRLNKIMAKDANPNLALRIQVEAGGCHGFQYLMKLVTLPALPPTPEPSTSDPESSTSPSATSPPPSAEIEAELAPSTTTSTQPAVEKLKEDDTVFTFVKDDAPPDADTHALAAGPKIVLDTTSLDLLKGSKLDFTMELIGSQFKITDNPAASSSCGCGTSFDIKL